MTTDATAVSIPIEELFPSPLNPRKHFDEAKLKELAASMAGRGVLEPLLIRKRLQGGYEVVAGERRWRAAALAGLEALDCVCRTMSDDEASEAMAVENLQRVDLTPVEEARAFQLRLRTIEKPADGGRYNAVAALASSIGKSEDYVRERLRLLKLEPTLQDACERGALPLKTCLLLSRVDDAKRRAELARVAIRGELTPLEIRERIRSDVIDLNRAPFALDRSPGGGVSGCDGCPKRLLRSGEVELPCLADDEKDLGACCDPECFEDKCLAYAQDRLHATVIGAADVKKRKAFLLYESSWKKGCPGCAHRLASISLAFREPIQIYCASLDDHYGRSGHATPPQRKEEREKIEKERRAAADRRRKHQALLAAALEWWTSPTAASPAERLRLLVAALERALNWDTARIAADLLGAAPRDREGVKQSLQAADRAVEQFRVGAAIALASLYGAAGSTSSDKFEQFCKSKGIASKAGTARLKRSARRQQARGAEIASGAARA